jgi:hypothetical protein
MERHSFRMIETNVIILRVVVEQSLGFVVRIAFFNPAVPLLWRRRLARV